MRNSHAIQVKYFGPTNNRGSRVPLSTYDLAQNKVIKRVFAYDYAKNGSLEQAVEIITEAGLEIIGVNDRNPKQDTVLCVWDWENLADLFNYEA